MSEACRAAVPHWRRSAYSGSTGGQCVEVAAEGDGLVRIRDSKDPDGPQLVVSAGCWRRFLGRLAAGPAHAADELVAAAERGWVLLRDARQQAGPVLRFTGGEWSVFRSGVHDGEFDLTADDRLRPRRVAAAGLGELPGVADPAGPGRRGRGGRLAA